MRKFKCVKFGVWQDNVTVGSVYDLVEFTNRIGKFPDIITIINDQGVEEAYYLYALGSEKIYFKEVTTEYRNEIIDEILE